MSRSIIVAIGDEKNGNGGTRMEKINNIRG